MNAVRRDLEWLLRPLAVDQFLADYWEKRPYTLFRGDEAYYRGLLTLADVDHVLASHDLRPPAVAMVKDGDPLPPEQFLTTPGANASQPPAVDVVKAMAAYQGGATIILDHLHCSWQPLARLCAEMERSFTHPTQTNVYLTPPGARGFDPHYDTHDVFILQVAGAKRWRLYDAALELPLVSQPYPHPAPPPPGPPTAEFVLRTGDLIYIPRGHVHAASTSDELSLHVTLGILTYTWADLFLDAVRCTLQSDVRFRRGLPVGFANDGAAADALAASAELVQALAASLRLPEQLAALTDRFVLSRLPMMDGHLRGLRDLPRLGAGSAVRKRAWLWRLTASGDHVTLLYHGKRLTLPRSLEPALRFMIATDRFTAAALPGPWDAEGKLGIVRRLVEEGFLTADT